MHWLNSRREITTVLSADPLRHVVLLKHLAAYPDHTRVYHVSNDGRCATAVVVDSAVSAYDRLTYPTARFAVLMTSDDPALTKAIVPALPRAAAIVFKLEHSAALADLASASELQYRRSFISFSASETFMSNVEARITTSPAEAAFELFESQGHTRSWLKPLLDEGRAFSCVHEIGGHVVCACFAFELFESVWEIGGVATDLPHRRRGFAATVVRTAVHALRERGLVPRYQVEASNTASVRLAQATGLQQFLTMNHYTRGC